MKCKNFERRAVKQPTRLDDLLQLWHDVAVAVAGSDNCTKSGIPGVFATQVVDDYAAYLLAIDKHMESK